MSQVINYGNEILRINTSKNSIEYSSNQGRLGIHATQALLVELLQKSM